MYVTCARARTCVRVRVSVRACVHVRMSVVRAQCIMVIHTLGYRLGLGTGFSSHVSVVFPNWHNHEYRC